MPEEKMQKHVMEILADAITVGASAAGLGEYLRDQCYYHSDLIGSDTNSDYHSAGGIISRLDWECEDQSERCKCEIVLLEDVLQDGIKVTSFAQYEGVSPCVYALLFYYEDSDPNPAAVVVTMMDDNCKLASINLCRNKELFMVELDEVSSDKKRKCLTNPFYINSRLKLNGKTVYLDHYPVKEVMMRCAQYMHSLDWVAIYRDAYPKNGILRGLLERTLILHHPKTKFCRPSIQKKAKRIAQ